MKNIKHVTRLVRRRLHIFGPSLHVSNNTALTIAGQVGSGVHDNRSGKHHVEEGLGTVRSDERDRGEKIGLC